MNYQNLPGPGDEATWPPYAGHPNDPRAPDSGEVDIHENPEYVSRVEDSDGWMLEAITEAPLKELGKLSEAILEEDEKLVGRLVIALVEKYCGEDL